MAAMKVTSQDLSGLGAAGASGAQETQKADGGGKSAGRGGGGSDRVDFSSTLGSLSRAMSSDGASRQAKVQALAAQYQSGRYTADSAAIGRGLISEALGQ
jgi:anti-sigma28 factor (negative regulator of flagellin synthesis)